MNEKAEIMKAANNLISLLSNNTDDELVEDVCSRVLNGDMFLEEDISNEING